MILVSIIPAKNKEINTLVFQVEELTRQVDRASSVNDAELFRLQSQLKELQRQHIDILEQNETTMKLKEEEMRRLYSEIGLKLCTLLCIIGHTHLHIKEDFESSVLNIRFSW